MSEHHIMIISKLAQDAQNPVAYAPSADERKAIANDLGLIKLSKLTFTGMMTGVGTRDWQLSGKLGATVVQPCVVTLEPVTTRIDEDITRTFLADWEDPEDPEVEMPEDDTIEPLRAEIDLGAVVSEALALSLPAFPKAPDAHFEDITVTEPGATPLTDEAAKPFAGLAALKDQLSKKD